MAFRAPYAHLHTDPNGPGDARPNASQIVKDQGLEGKLGDKVILITGVTSGIGIETARALYATGARTFITAREVGKGTEVAESLTTDASRPVEVIKLSLDSFASIRAAASEILEKTDKLNILVANAGVMATPYGKTTDGFETQFATNHLGHFLLFELLKPALLAGANSCSDFASRVVIVSSSGHRMTPGIRFHDLNFEEQADSYNPWVAYGQSKLANVYFANELDRRYGPKRLHALSLHPGSIATQLQKHIADGTMSAASTDPAYVAQKKSAEQGAATSVWAAIGKEWEGKGGRYLNDVQEAEAVPVDGPVYAPGYSKLAYDPQAERQLWEASLKMVGLDDQ